MAYQTSQFIMSSADAIISRASMLTFYFKEVLPKLEEITNGKITLGAYTANELRVIIKGEDFDVSELSNIPYVSEVKDVLKHTYVLTINKE